MIETAHFSLSYHLTLLGFWLAWVFLHSYLATENVKRFMQTTMGKNYSFYRLSYSIFAAVTLGLILAYQFSTASPLLYLPSLWLQIAGVALGLVGLAGMGVCIRKYFLYLSGVDVLLKEKIQAVLEVGGLHRFMRHPLYSTTLLFCWSLFILFPFSDNLLACAVITLYTLLGIRLEEKKLVNEFGNQYTSYAANTPMLIPDVRKLLTS